MDHITPVATLPPCRSCGCSSARARCGNCCCGA